MGDQRQIGLRKLTAFDGSSGCSKRPSNRLLFDEGILWKNKEEERVFFLEPITYYFCGFFSQNTPADMDDLKERVEDLEVEMSKIAKGGGGSAAVPVAAGAAAGGLGGAAAGAALADGVPMGPGQEEVHHIPFWRACFCRAESLRH